MKIVVDAMGGDNAPAAAAFGAVRAARKDPELEIILVGDTELIQKTLDEKDETLPDNVHVEPCSEVIGMDEDPTSAIKHKKDSSMVVGLSLVRDGHGDAFVSAGSTGALLTGATLITKRIRGIRRAALAPKIPTKVGKAVLIDCGATAECTPEYLLQFAYMGSFYAKSAMHIETPRVALLNIGTEESKGTELQRTAFAAMQKAGEEGRIHFIGNIEAREAILGGTDVIVTDGYTGNIFLKTMEGTAKLLISKMQPVVKKNVFTKIGALSVHGDLRSLLHEMSSRTEGGTAFLGIEKPVIKAHGNSDDVAIEHAIQRACEVAESGIIQEIENNIEYMKLGQPANLQNESENQN